MFQGAPGVSLEGQKGEPGVPGYSSASLRSNNEINVLFMSPIRLLVRHLYLLRSRRNERPDNCTWSSDVPEQEINDKCKRNYRHRYRRLLYTVYCNDRIIYCLVDG